MSKAGLLPGYVKPDPGEMPSGWIASQLGNLCKIVQGGRLGVSKQDDYGRGSVRAFSAAGQDGYVNVAEFAEADGVVLSSIGANCGRAFFASGRWTTLANTQAIIPRRELDARFLYYRVNDESFWLRSGSAQPFIKPSSISTSWIALPPLEEQRRIAEILDKLDSQMRTSESLCAKLADVIAGLQHALLNDAVVGGTTRSLREGPVSSLLGDEFPGEWGEAAPRSSLVECAVLRSTNLSDRGIDYSGAATRFVPSAKAQRKRLRRGDILLEASGGGPGVPVGRVAVFDPPDERRYLVSNFFRTLRTSSGVNSRYVAWLLDFVYSTPGIWSFQQQTTGIINLNVRDYLAMRVSVPDRSEQDRTVEALGSAAGRVALEQDLSGKLRQIRAAVASDLLSGRVRTVAA